MTNPYIKSILFQFFSFLYCVNLENTMAEAAVLQISRIDGLCHGSSVKMQSFHRGIKPSVGSVFISSNTVVVKEDMNDNAKLNVTIDRCSSMENLDSCEPYHGYGNVDYCRLINPEEGNPNFLKFGFNPPFKCPHVKGTYKAYNTTIDVTPFTMFLTEGSYWKIKIEVRTTTTLKLVYCLKIDLRVTSK